MACCVDEIPVLQVHHMARLLEVRTALNDLTALGSHGVSWHHSGMFLVAPAKCLWGSVGHPMNEPAYNLEKYLQLQLKSGMIQVGSDLIKKKSPEHT